MSRGGMREFSMRCAMLLCAAALAACSPPAARDTVEAEGEAVIAAVGQAPDGSFMARAINVAAPNSVPGCAPGRVLTPQDPVDGVVWTCANDVKLSLWIRTSGWASPADALENARELLPPGDWRTGEVKGVANMEAATARSGVERRRWHVRAEDKPVAVFGAAWKASEQGADAEALRALDALEASVTRTR